MDSICGRIEPMHKVKLLSWNEVMLAFHDDHLVDVNRVADDFEVFLTEVVEVDAGYGCSELGVGARN
jgi:hypothetical protein